MDKFKALLSAAFGEFLWLVILIPILAISWLGFYRIARDVGIPPIFAAGMSSAFDGVAIFAARIGLKHRRKGFSGYLARMTVLVFIAFGAFVQTFHAQSHSWIVAHSWIVWATAPVAAGVAYELHLGWVHRKQLVRKGYHHPSAKSGYGPATWLLTRGTFGEYRDVLRARRDYISESNLKRFQIEESLQPQLAAQPVLAAEPGVEAGPDTVHVAPEVDEEFHRATDPSLRVVIADNWASGRLPEFHELPAPTVPNPVLTLQEPEPEVEELQDVHNPDGTPEPAPTPPVVVPIKRATPEPVSNPEPLRRAARHEPKPAARPANRPATRTVQSQRPTSKTKTPSSRPASSPPRRGNSLNAEIREWCVAHGFQLGYNNRVPIDGLRAYRAAHSAKQRAS
jgi:hypothetical protein